MTEPAPLDGRFVPRARDVASVMVDGEAIIHHAGSLHHLNRTATVVWQCCDGDSDLDTLVTELAAGFAIDAEIARADIGGVVAELVMMDLLLPAAHDTTDLDGVESGVDGGVALTVLVDPDETCASCAERPWTHNAAYAVGDVLAPIAVDDPVVGQALDAALAAQLVPSVGPLTPYYAVVVPPLDRSGRRRGLYALQRGATVAVQSRGLSRVLHALLVHLASHGDLGARGLVAIPALVVAANRRALLVPRPVRPVAFARALARRGVTVADAPAALVDPIEREIIVGAPGLLVDLRALQSAIDTHPIHGNEPAALPWGRYELGGLAVAGSAGGAKSSRARAGFPPATARPPSS